MDIRVSGAISAYNMQAAKRHAPATAPSRRDTSVAGSLSLSPQAADYQLAKQAVLKLPIQRQDLVDHFKAQIEAGTYNVSGEQIAAKIFEGLA